MPKITSDEKLRAIAEENDIYLRHLRNTGNASMAARFAKRARETFTGRRRADPAFNAACAAALVFARAALVAKGGAAPAASSAAGAGVVAQGGEYMVGANLNNGLQVRRARPGHVTARGEAAFLEALSVTANIQLAAEAIGVDPRAFYKRRAQSEDFARRMQEALAAGYEAVEFALVKTALRSLAPEADGGGAHDGGPVEPARMSVDQAMTLIAQRTKTMAIGNRHVRGVFHKPVTPEETNAAILKKLRVMERQQREEERELEEREAKRLSDGRG